MDSSIKILDCTLRDGGYVNNWEFGEENIKSIINKLSQSRVDIIECGLLGKTVSSKNSTKFNGLEDIERFIPQERNKTIYTCMMNYAEKDELRINRKNPNSVDCIRIAFFKPENEKAIEYARMLMDYGYMVFLQAMATSLYSKSEIKNMIKEVNRCKPYGFSLVDSFGTLYNEDVISLSEQIGTLLNREILFGFHSHNNIQMAFSNAIAFINANVGRNIVVDSTVHGMGRGAGNACTELVAKYLNSKHNKNYDIEELIFVFEDSLKQIYDENYWGYSNVYFLTSLKDINSAYIWYLSTKGIKDLKLINFVLDKIPTESRYFLDKGTIDKILEEIK